MPIAGVPKWNKMTNLPRFPPCSGNTTTACTHTEEEIKREKSTQDAIFTNPIRPLRQPPSRARRDIREMALGNLGQIDKWVGGGERETVYHENRVTMRPIGGRKDDIVLYRAGGLVAHCTLTPAIPTSIVLDELERVVYRPRRRP